jgi:hypothetical protein
MREFLAACVVAVALAVGAVFVLEVVQQPSSSAFTTTGVRI